MNTCKYSKEPFLRLVVVGSSVPLGSFLSSLSPFLFPSGVLLLPFKSELAKESSEEPTLLKLSLLLDPTYLTLLSDLANPASFDNLVVSLEYVEPTEFLVSSVGSLKLANRYEEASEFNPLEQVSSDVLGGLDWFLWGYWWYLDTENRALTEFGGLTQTDNQEEEDNQIRLTLDEKQFPLE